MIFQRTELLIGSENLEKLKKSKELDILLEKVLKQLSST